MQGSCCRSDISNNTLHELLCPQSILMSVFCKIAE